VSFHGAHGTVGILLVVAFMAMRIFMRRGFGGMRGGGRGRRGPFL
jgi:hypothetical protein